MITDTELLHLVMSRNADKDPDFVIAEFTAYKKKLAMLQLSPVDTVAEGVQAEAAPIKKPTKRNLKCDPATAIDHMSIRCCLCEKEGRRLSSVHLASHGITPEEYRKLCGYAPEQPLMGTVVYERSLRAMHNAQEARKRKKAMTGGMEDL
ncbi:MAG: MucR family transcriptional regulator [Desulfovibrionaceae bacterium]|nr:MucR family transcriptional regulator [Desulfovibrionaceae bacterium]